MRNTFLDIIRGISCILIIFIHRPFPGLFGNIIQAIGRAGVAVFFIISGYYAYNQSRITMIKRLPKKIRHVLIILLSAFFYYLVWESFIRWFGTGFSSTYDWITNHVLSPYIWYLALVWDKDPVAGHLWFLFSLVRCYLLFCFLLKIRWEKFAPFISVVCLGTAFVLQKMDISTYYYRNGWFYGMGFFLAGYFIATCSGQNLNRNIVYASIGLGIVLSIFGGIIFPKDQIYLSTIILGLSVFYLAVTQTGINVKHPFARLMAEIGAKYGTLIYVIHWSIKECMIKLDKTFVFTQRPLYQWISPIILAILSIVACVILYNTKEIFPNAVRKNNE